MSPDDMSPDDEEAAREELVEQRHVELLAAILWQDARSEMTGGDEWLNEMGQPHDQRAFDGKIARVALRRVREIIRQNREIDRG